MRKVNKICFLLKDKLSGGNDEKKISFSIYYFIYSTNEMKITLKFQCEK